ncbi:MAG: hypothetical protein ACI4MR_06400, partial [Candidatus Aphodomorpha sp.]
MAQNAFEQALTNAHIPDTVRVDSVRLSREKHQLTVFLHAENPLSNMQKDALSNALTALFPDITVCLECNDAAAAV